MVENSFGHDGWRISSPGISSSDVILPVRGLGMAQLVAHQFSS